MTSMNSRAPSTVDATQDARPRKFSLGRMFAYVLVIGLGLACGLVLATISGFFMGWITIQC